MPRHDVYILTMKASLVRKRSRCDAVPKNLALTDWIVTDNEAVVVFDEPRFNSAPVTRPGFGYKDAQFTL